MKTGLFAVSILSALLLSQSALADAPRPFPVDMTSANFVDSTFNLYGDEILGDWEETQGLLMLVVDGASSTLQVTTEANTQEGLVANFKCEVLAVKHLSGNRSGIVVDGEPEVDSGDMCKVTITYPSTGKKATLGIYAEGT